MCTKRKNHLLCIHFAFLIAIWTPLYVAADVKHLPATSPLHFISPAGLVQAEREAFQHHSLPHMVEEHSKLSPRIAIPFDNGHFNFSNDEWSVVKLPESDDEQMIVAHSADPLKKLKLSIPVRAFSDLIFRYEIYLTKNAEGNNPKFGVFLVEDDQRILIKEETPEGNWTSSAIRVQTGLKNGKLLFIAFASSEENEIALKNFTQEDGLILDQNRYASRFEDFSSSLPSRPFFVEDPTRGLNAGENNTPLINGRIHSIASSPLHESIDNHSFMLPIAEDVSPHETSSGTDFIDSNWFFSDSNPNDTIPQEENNGSKYTTSLEPSSGNGEGSVFPTSSGAIETNSSYTSFLHDSIIENDNDFMDGNKTTADNGLNQNETNSTHSSTISVLKEITSFSSTQNIFNFFLVIMVVSITVILFIVWKKRRRRREDEIPVFTRSATEHGNPAFDDEVTVPSEAPANYRSFR